MVLENAREIETSLRLKYLRNTPGIIGLVNLYYDRSVLEDYSNVFSSYWNRVKLAFNIFPVFKKHMFQPPEIEYF